MSDEKQPINIYGGYNSIAPRATAATQTVSSPNGQAPESAPTANSHPSALNCRVFVKHDSIGVPQLLRQACQHIVFDAAYYPNYAVGSQSEDVKEALRQHPDLTLTVIHTDIEHAPWADEFAHSLRTGFKTKEDFEPYMNLSRRFFADLQKEYGSTRVQLYNSARLPFFPVILIDDTLVIGHYAHSRIIPHHGLWLTIQHPSIPAMYATLLLGRTPVCHSNDEEVLLHYLEELVPQDLLHSHEPTKTKQEIEVETKEQSPTIIKNDTAVPELPVEFSESFRSNDEAVAKFFELLLEAGPYIGRPEKKNGLLSAEKFSRWRWKDLRDALIHMKLLSKEVTTGTFSEFIHVVFPDRSKEGVFRSLYRDDQKIGHRIVPEVAMFFKPVRDILKCDLHP